MPYWARNSMTVGSWYRHTTKPWILTIASAAAADHALGRDSDWVSVDLYVLNAATGAYDLTDPNPLWHTGALCRVTLAAELESGRWKLLPEGAVRKQVVIAERGTP